MYAKVTPVVPEGRLRSTMRMLRRTVFLGKSHSSVTPAVRGRALLVLQSTLDNSVFLVVFTLIIV